MASSGKQCLYCRTTCLLLWSSTSQLADEEPVETVLQSRQGRRDRSRDAGRRLRPETQGQPDRTQDGQPQVRAETLARQRGCLSDYGAGRLMARFQRLRSIILRVRSLGLTQVQPSRSAPPVSVIWKQLTRQVTGLVSVGRTMGCGVNCREQRSCVTQRKLGDADCRQSNCQFRRPPQAQNCLPFPSELIGCSASARLRGGSRFDSGQHTGYNIADRPASQAVQMADGHGGRTV